MKISPFGVGVSVAAGVFCLVVAGVGTGWDFSELRASIVFEDVWKGRASVEKKEKKYDLRKHKKLVKRFRDIQLKESTKVPQAQFFEHWEDLRDDWILEYRLEFGMLFPENQPRTDEFEYQIKYGGSLLWEGVSPEVQPGTMVDFVITAPESGEYEVWQKLPKEDEFTKIDTVETDDRLGVAATSDMWGSVHQLQFETLMDTLRDINTELVGVGEGACRVCSTQGIQAPQLQKQNAACMQAACGMK